MTAWARLTWQTADPAALAADLEHRLGASAQAHEMLTGVRVLHLGDTDLELVPWRREAADDEPQAARLDGKSPHRRWLISDLFSIPC